MRETYNLGDIERIIASDYSTKHNYAFSFKTSKETLSCIHTISIRFKFNHYITYFLSINVFLVYPDICQHKHQLLTVFHYVLGKAHQREKEKYDEITRINNNVR